MSLKLALVTGAASGIGECISLSLITSGYVVFAIDKNIIGSGTGENLIPIQCDVSKEEEVKNAFDIIAQYTDQIDSLINCAGVLCSTGRYSIDEVPLDEWKAVLETNLTGCLLMMKFCIPFLKRSDYATIINFSSDQTVRPIVKSAPYLVSKCGVEGLTKLAALELVSEKIRVNCIRSATVDTPFLKPLVKEPEIRRQMSYDMDAKMPLGIISPKDITDMVHFLLSLNSHCVTGQILTIDSGVLL